MKPRIRLLLIVTLLLSAMATTSVFASSRSNQRQAGSQREISTKFELTEAQLDEVQRPGYYIVRLEDEPLAAYEGTLREFAATSPLATGEAFDLDSPASQAYQAYLQDQQAAVLESINTTLGRGTLDVLHHYSIAFNGFAVYLTPTEAQQISNLAGVARVKPQFIRQLETDVSPEFIGATDIWDGSATPAVGTMGEGMIIGIIDSGINMDHPSFAGTGGDGYVHPMPNEYVGWCNDGHEKYDSSLVCNSKLIGVYSYPESGDDPEDDNGHGSHTASTAAGNIVDATLYGIERTISGMAPHAHIIAYDVCNDDGCQGASILAAIEDAIADGVQVINYSIGADSAANPWVEDDDIAFLNALKAGVLPVTSAGNAGPNASTIGTPAGSPWMLSVGNTTHNRFMSDISISLANEADLQNVPAIQGDGTPLETALSGSFRYAGDVAEGNEEGCEPFAEDAFAGQIAVISRGSCNFSDKTAHAADAGAIGVVVFNNRSGLPFGMSGTDNVSFPAVMVDQATGEAIIAALAGGTLEGVIEPGGTYQIDNALADQMASGSSRGPYGFTGVDVIKPDIAAPGTNIWAAVNSPEGSTEAEYSLLSGTSMSSPHVAGSALLMMSLNPNWTASQVRSALMMTAYNDTSTKEDGTTPADPFDIGAGRVDLTKAALTGLVMDIDPDDFDAENPVEGGDPSILNIPSMQDSTCVSSCTFVRTVTSVADDSTTWSASIVITSAVSATVTPASFTLNPGESQDLTITVDVSGAETDQYYFGELVLTGAGSPEAHMPIAVQPSKGSFQEKIEIETRRDAGAATISGDAIEVTALQLDVFGLTKSVVHPAYVTEDSDNAAVFDNPDDYEFLIVNVPENSARFVTEIYSSESPDLDLFIGYDVNGDGMPQEEELVAFSASGTALEYVSLQLPFAGDYWVVVQNWSASSAGATDFAEVGIAVVPMVDANNLAATGPAAVPPGTEFDIDLTYDIDMEPGDVYYGVVAVGTDADNPGNIVIVDVDLLRLGDDVEKNVSAEDVMAGDVISYTVSVLPNDSFDTAVTYTITDVIPAGVTLIPSSVSASAGTATVTGSTITWEVQQNVPTAPPSYIITTNKTDESCDTPFPEHTGYFDLKTEYGFTPIPSISGDSIIFSLTDFGTGFDFYGTPIVDRPYFIDDGFIPMEYTGVDSIGEAFYLNRPMPDAELPNAILAPLWTDMEYVYDIDIEDPDINKGVSGAASEAFLLYEVDDAQLYGQPTETLDYEWIAFAEADLSEGSYDMFFAYDNVNLSSAIGTIGVENRDGTAGTQLAYDDLIPTDGLVVCLDLVAAYVAPAVLTYDVTVDSAADFCAATTNIAEHLVDADGAMPDESSVTIYAEGCVTTEDDSVARHLEADSNTSQAVPLTNEGADPVVYSAEISYKGRDGWLTIDPATGSIASGATVSPELMLNSNGLENGLYRATIEIYVEAEESGRRYTGTEPSRTINVTLNVAESLNVSMVESAVAVNPMSGLLVLSAIVLSGILVIMLRRQRQLRN